MNEMNLDIEVEVLEDRIAPSLIPVTLFIDPAGGRATPVVDVNIRENAFLGIREASASGIMEVSK